LLIAKISEKPHDEQFNHDRHSEQFKSNALDGCGTRSLSILSNSLRQLHQQISRNPTSPEDPEKSKIKDIIASYAGEEAANCVNQCLQWHMEATGACIKSLKASVVYPFTGDNPCPLLQWREGNDMDVMALYLVEPNNRVGTDPELHGGSWIMHFGRGISSDIHGHHWENSFVAWRVTEMSYLKTLFQTAQHIFGILKWPKEDAYRLYCEQGAEECSTEE
jgi:hypothetical protein